jgi:hypothetical protein
MRHLFFAAVLLLAALIVTLGAATLLENMANNQRPDQDDQPFLPGASPPAQVPAPQLPAPSGRPAVPEQSRSLSLLRRT